MLLCSSLLPSPPLPLPPPLFLLLLFLLLVIFSSRAHRICGFGAVTRFGSLTGWLKRVEEKKCRQKVCRLFQKMFQKEYVAGVLA